MISRWAITVAVGMMLAMVVAGGSVAAGDRSAHDFSFTAIDGQPLPLSAYKGKAVLVVNTASQCGYTKQYGPLQELYEKYKDRGFVVIGVPSNDFGGQEPASEKEIAAFTKQEFRVAFPLTSKSSVKGQNAAPFYKWAGNQVGFLGQPRWNFHKYLVDPQGRVVEWFSTMTEPNSEKLHRAIEKHLPKSFSEEPS